MGKEAIAREMRRETKRTLGNKLQEFAQNERKRLDAVESTTLNVAKDLDEFTTRGFLGRLKWILFGR